MPDPAPASSPSVPPRGRRMPPAAPGPAAGFPIGPSERQRQPIGLPPGIPAAAAGVIMTTGTSPAQPAPAADLHPSFAPLPAQTVQVRQTAESLRSILRSLITSGQNGVRIIDQSLAVFETASPDLLKAEGLDIPLIRSFRAGIQSALDLAAPPPAPTPAPAAADS